MKRLCITLILAAAGVFTALGETRSALVIGNGEYGLDGVLASPTNDAAGMSSQLGNLAFKPVATVTNANRASMVAEITRFGQQLAKSDVGLFYFSGHGLQHKGRNYLIPIGCALNSADDLETQAINLDLILSKMSASPCAVNIVILDCCRTNQFKDNTGATAGHGLAAVEATRLKGTIIAYSTAPGTDSTGPILGGYSFYTAGLLAEMKKPNTPLSQIFINVRANLIKKYPTQIPWESSSLTEDFYFSRNSSDSSAPSSQALPPGTYEGTVTFAYPDKSEMVSQRVVEVTDDTGILLLNSVDYYKSAKNKKIRSTIRVRGRSTGLLFESKTQMAVSTEYKRWEDEDFRMEFAKDGSTAVLTSTFHDNHNLVVGSGVLRKRK